MVGYDKNQVFERRIYYNFPVSYLNYFNAVARDYLMANKEYDFKSGNQLSKTSILIWRTAQLLVWVLGAAIMFCLFFYPALGVLLFWNILIPVAPALFVLATGLWRNVCPLATTILLPRHTGLSLRKKLSSTQLGKLNLIAVISLFLIVPLRHALFNNNGPATAILIIAMAATGIVLGFVYEWKSVWCSGLCPVHPVEKLYGGNVLMPVPNAHCSECMNCVVPCPDSTPNMRPTLAKKNSYQAISGILIAGGLPGFIYGWFHVPDETALRHWQDFFSVYTLPLAGGITSLLVYLLLTNFTGKNMESTWTRIFAAASVSCYYLFRIPSLLGFGNYGKDGLLINLSNVLPSWSILALTISTTCFFFYWIIVRKPNQNSWLIRPRYGNNTITTNTAKPALLKVKTNKPELDANP